MPDPWYTDGLHFSCTGCGHCCTGAPGYVWVTAREVRDLARFHALSVDDFSKRYLRRVSGRLALVERPNGDCVFYDDGCTVYSARPTQCRTFPFWPENLKSRAVWDRTAGECPGIGHGTFYSADAIRSIRRGKEEACTRFA